MLKVKSLDTRSKTAVKNIAGSIVLKAISIAVSLLLVPLTIRYVSPEKYGIWLSLTSIVSWLYFFDVGISNGMRNRLAESFARDDKQGANRYLSTSYIAISAIFVLVFLLFLLINGWLDWSSILSVDKELNDELSIVMIIVVGFFCLNMILGVFNSLLMALQKPAVSSLISTTGQVFVLVAIAVLVYLRNGESNGGLVSLAICLSGIPCMVTGVVSYFSYHSKYKDLAPTIKYYDKTIIPDILNLGWKFFLIQISFILVFQVSNVIIIREVDAISVTQYNIAYRYFMVGLMVFNILLTPFWSAFTDAFEKKDYPWMNLTYQRLSKCWWGLCGAMIVLLIISPMVYKIWIGDQVLVPFSLSVAMAIYVIINSRAGLYMTLLNGTGKVYLQMITYVIIGIISVPLMVLLTKLFGLLGTISVLTASVLVLFIVGHIQLNRILKQSDSGIWSK